MRRTLALLVLLAAAAGAVPSALAGSGTAQDPYVFGIVPARSPARLMATFGPMLKSMAEALNIRITLRGAPSYGTFVRRVTRGGYYDFVLNGGDTFQYARTRGIKYQPVARMKGPGVYVVFAVQRDGPYQNLQDLKGRRVVSANFMSYASGLGFRALEQAGLDLNSDLYLMEVPTQSASLLTLAAGRADAAIIMVPVWRSRPEKLQQSLRRLSRSERAPPPLVSARPGIPRRVVAAMRGYLLGMSESDDGRALLKTMGWPGFSPVRVEDYDALHWAADSIAERLRAVD